MVQSQDSHQPHFQQQRAAVYLKQALINSLYTSTVCSKQQTGTVRVEPVKKVEHLVAEESGIYIVIGDTNTAPMG